jgi:hypothetical protein
MVPKIDRKQKVPVIKLKKLVRLIAKQQLCQKSSLNKNYLSKVNLKQD